MPSTIRDLNELLVPATNDYFIVSDTSDTSDRDKKMQLSKMPMKSGTPVAGRVAEWVDANFVQAGSFLTSDIVRKTGTPVANNVSVWNSANILADGGFALSDIARLSTAQTFSALKTFSAGVNFGQDTLNFFELGNWTPTLTFGGANTGMSPTQGTGRYMKIANWVFLSMYYSLSNKGSAVGNALISGVPYPGQTGARWAGSILATNLSYTGLIQVNIGNNATTFTLDQMSEAGTVTNLANTNFANNTAIEVCFVYPTN